LYGIPPASQNRCGKLHGYARTAKIATGNAQLPHPLDRKVPSRDIDKHRGNPAARPSPLAARATARPGACRRREIAWIHPLLGSAWLNRRGLAERTSCRIAISAHGRGNPFRPWPGGTLPGRGHVVRPLGGAALVDTPDVPRRRLALGRGTPPVG